MDPRPHPARRALAGLLVTATAVTATAVTASPVAADEPTPPPVTQPGDPGAAPYAYTFLSSPDFTNADLGDVRRAKGWHPGLPNSTDRGYRESLDHVLDAFAAEDAPDVLVAGDLVNGHWQRDTARTGTFGPTRTVRQKVAAVREAARTYYPQWREWFDEHGLRPWAAVGDHEVGDDPWRGGSVVDDNAFKQRTLAYWKKFFGRYALGSRTRDAALGRPSGPARHTAYAVMLHPEVEVVSLDVFRDTGDDVEIEVDPRQLRWLDDVLTDAEARGVDWTVVQFHTPVVGPVRSVGSSELMYHRGTRSALWQMLVRHRVDLVLNGEVHAITAHQPRPGDPVQITHGGLFAFGRTSFLRVEATPEQLSITAKAFRQRVRGRGRGLWQSDDRRPLPRSITYGDTYVAGTMTLTADGTITERTGLLDVYRGQP